MNDPPRLRDGDDAVARLLASSRRDEPKAASRRRALAFAMAGASAGTSLTLSSSAAASIKGIATKSLLIYLSTGAALGAGGAFMAAELAVSSNEPPVKPFVRPNRAATTPAPHADAEPATSAPPISSLPPVEASAHDAPPRPRALPPRGAASTAEPAVSAPAPAIKPKVFDQLRVLDAARAAIAQGDARRALSALDDYDTRFIAGHFRPEADVLRIEALRLSGDSAAASKRAAEFQLRFPRHPSLTRVQREAED